MRIIGLSGLAGAGKSTAAGAILREHGGWEVSFADEIKRIAQRLYGFSPLDLWGPSVRRETPYPAWLRPDGSVLTVREACQKIGTEVARAIHPDTWVRFGIADVCERLLRAPFEYDYDPPRGLYWVGAGSKRRANHIVVIPDCRFPNEVAAIQRAGGAVVRIRRPGAGLSGDAAAHASEAGQDGIPDSAFDGVLVNDKTLRDLEFDAVQLASDLMGR